LIDPDEEKQKEKQ